MFISPIQNNNATPVITQGFGYTAFANAGSYGYKDGKPLPHTGIDLRTRGVINLYCPTNGVVQVRDSGSKGYGLHIVIRDPNGWEIKLSHLSKAFLKDGDSVRVGDLIGKTGTSGFSTAHHLHYGVRPLVKSDKDIWEWSVKNYDDTFHGYIDPVKLTLTWQGTFDIGTLNYLTASALEGVFNRKNIT